MLSFIKKPGQAFAKPCVKEHLKMFTTGTGLQVHTIIYSYIHCKICNNIPPFYNAMYDILASSNCHELCQHNVPPGYMCQPHPTHSSHTLSPFLSLLCTITSQNRTPSGNQSPNNPLFHYDCPRPVAYDVPRASVRSRGGSFQSSNDTLHTAISNEVKNPMYITKQG